MACSFLPVAMLRRMLASKAGAAAAVVAETASLSVQRVLLKEGAMDIRGLAQALPLEHFKSLTHLKNNVLAEMERRHAVRKLCVRSDAGKRVWAWEIRKPFEDPKAPGQMFGPGTANPPSKPLYAEEMAREDARYQREIMDTVRVPTKATRHGRK